MALVARDQTDSDTLRHAAEEQAAEGSVATLERALTEASIPDDVVVAEPVAPDEPDPDAVLATITSLQEFVRQANEPRP
jgi:hypothetical protein